MVRHSRACCPVRPLLKWVASLRRETAPPAGARPARRPAAISAQIGIRRSRRRNAIRRGHLCRRWRPPNSAGAGTTGSAAGGRSACTLASAGAGTWFVADVAAAGGASSARRLRRCGQAGSAAGGRSACTLASAGAGAGMRSGAGVAAAGGASAARDGSAGAGAAGSAAAVDRRAWDPPKQAPERHSAWRFCRRWRLRSAR